jgi:hypothetical protein
MPPTNPVNSTPNPAVVHVIHNIYNHVSSSISVSKSIVNPSVLSQPGPLGFILIGLSSLQMVGQHVGSLTRYPKFWGKGDEDVEQHWFLCESIWRSHKTLDTSKLVKF